MGVRKPSWARRGLQLAALLITLLALFVAANVIFAAAHYLGQDGHQLAQDAAVAHPIILTTLGRPAVATPRFCHSFLGRYEVAPRVAIDQHTFAVAGPKGEARVDVFVQARRGIKWNYDVVAMTMETGGKTIALDAKRLAEGRRHKRSE